ncbi:MAG: hypothetical protein ABI672_15075 [Vicinamibacteria bacterium]
MKMPRTFAASLLSLAVLLPGPSAVAAEKQRTAPSPMNSVVEKISFENVSPLNQWIVLSKVGGELEPGRMMTPEAARTLARRLKDLPAGHTFSYKAGSRPGRIVLAISATC